MQRFSGKLTTTTPSGEHRRIGGGDDSNKNRRTQPGRNMLNKPGGYNVQNTQHKHHRAPPQGQRYNSFAPPPGALPPASGMMGRPGVNDLRNARHIRNSPVLTTEVVVTTVIRSNITIKMATLVAILYTKFQMHRVVDQECKVQAEEEMVEWGVQWPVQEPVEDEVIQAVAVWECKTNRSARGLSMGIKGEKIENEELANSSPNGQLYFSRQSRQVNFRPKTLAEYKKDYNPLNM